MRKHDFRRKFGIRWEKGVIKLLLVFVALVLVAFLSVTLFPNEEMKTYTNTFYRLAVLFRSEVSISVYVSALVSTVVLVIGQIIKNRSEEFIKLNDDHSEIIHKYNVHYQKAGKDREYISDTNYYQEIGDINGDNATGIDLQIRKIGKKKRKIYNTVLRSNPSKRNAVQSDIDCYLNNNFLRIPNASIFANVKQNTGLRFNFTETKFKLDDFLVNVVSDLFVAHKYSYALNNYTLRLDDAHYDAKTDLLTLYTRPTTYYNMLLTNRCMDYELARGITIRNMFEYRNKVSNLRSSTLSNQIGINGLIITKDGYLLLERRTRKKTTWKNKFAQPISLSTKFDDLVGFFKTETVFDEESGRYVDHIKEVSDDPARAEQMFKKIIVKTIESNYGLKNEDDYTFEFSKSFMGIARDLVEGGKPNFYFYIVLNKDAKDAKKIIEKASAISEFKNERKAEDKDKKAISRSKLDSFYYFVRYEDIFVDFKEKINIRNRHTIWVRRKLPRHFCWIASFGNLLFYHLFEKHFFMKKQAGDALLASLAYLELIHTYHPIEAIKDVKIARKGAN